MFSLKEAHDLCFDRYQEILQSVADWDSPPQTDRRHLLWMCQEAKKNQWPDDKTSRWLGFVQGVLAARGLLDVSVERNITRAWFHQAYKTKGLTPPASIDP